MVTEIGVALPSRWFKNDDTRSKWEIADQDVYYKWYIAYFVLGNIDSMVSCAFVILTFSFANAWYSCLCGCPHAQCMRLWLRKPNGPLSRPLVAFSTVER